MRKKDYVDLVRDLAGDLQAVRRGADGTTAKLAEKEAKLRDADLKVRLLAEVADVLEICRNVYMTRQRRCR